MVECSSLSSAIEGVKFEDKEGHSTRLIFSDLSLDACVGFAFSHYKVQGHPPDPSFQRDGPCMLQGSLQQHTSH